MQIRTALTRAELTILTHIARDRNVYEAGALLGASTVALAREARHVVSVDPHRDYPYKGARETWGPFNHNIRQANVSARVVAVRSIFENVPLYNATLAVADLTGKAAVTSAFLEKVRQVPLIAIHDYCRMHCDGATRTVDQWIARHKPRAIMRVDTLIIMER